MKNLNALKVRRIQAGLSQTQMAKLLGISYQAYNPKENGKKKFSELQKREICRILNCDNSIFEE